MGRKILMGGEICFFDLGINCSFKATHSLLKSPSSEYLNLGLVFTRVRTVYNILH